MPWQPSAVKFPDVELVLTTYFRAALTDAGEADVYVSNTMPATRRDRMVLVRRDGGTVVELRDRPRVSIQVWDTTEQAATDLARTVHALALAAPDGMPIVQVVPQSGPIPVADDSGQPLRLIVAEFHTRGEALT
jgi:hypothetical protein